MLHNIRLFDQDSRTRKDRKLAGSKRSVFPAFLLSSEILLSTSYNLKTRSSILKQKILSRQQQFLSMSKALVLLLLGCLVSLAAGYNLVTVPNDDRVKVDFYFESLCPYCQQYIVGALKTAANTADFWKICDFNLYPYGNARRTQNGSSWSFTCQHGVRECEGNLIETCALRLYDKYTQALPFIICLESSSSDWTAQGKKCAQQYSLDWNAISSCATSQKGIDYQVEMAIATESLVPVHTYVPWVVVNGAHSQSAENAVQSNMVRYVCSIYKGSEKIAACK